MAFMLARQAERHWRRLNGSEAMVHVGLGRRMPGQSPWLFPGAIQMSKVDDSSCLIRGRKGWVDGDPQKHYSYSGLINAHNEVCEETAFLFDPYLFRHTFATRLYERTKDIVAVAKILGPSDLKTVMRYVHPDQEQMKAAMHKFEKGLQCDAELVQ